MSDRAAKFMVQIALIAATTLCAITGHHGFAIGFAILLVLSAA